MKKIAALAVLAFLPLSAAFADELGLSPIAPSSARIEAGSQFVLPVVGEVQGLFGTFFHTDVMLINLRNADQTVLMQWIPRDQNGTQFNPLQMTLRANAFFPMRNFAQQFATDGQIGSVLITAVKTDGTLDTDARIDGFARIYTNAPNSGPGTVSQAAQAVTTNRFGTGDRAILLGLRQDANFRTNVGIVNLDGQLARTFDITVSGSGQSTTLTLTVQPLSMAQVPIGTTEFSDLVVSIRNRADNGGAWTAYGSSVDNRSGDGWISLPVED